MATFCDGIVQNIERTECIGNSLVKINSNFSGLETAGCDLENELQSEINELQSEVANLLSLINTLSSDMKMEPALSKTYAGQFTTPQIVTSSPAVLYGCNIKGGAGNGEGQARIFSNNEMKMVAYEYTPGSPGDFVFDRGVDCPDGIQITLNTTCSAVVYYNLK